MSRPMPPEHHRRSVTATLAALGEEDGGRRLQDTPERDRVVALVLIIVVVPLNLAALHNILAINPEVGDERRSPNQI